ncbi:MAG: Fe(2+)-trafficking protein [Phycisphaerales bacterium]
MDHDTRISQFEQMVADDPASDIAHFSLGRALSDAGRHREAATAFERCIAVNDANSKAYQLAAEAYIAAKLPDKAVPLLQKGYETATLRGDLMPKNAMKDLLASLGHPVPEVFDPSTDEIPEGAFVCSKTGRPGTQMERPPFKGPVGEWIQANISRQTFDEWIRQGTKVINELRLDLSRDEDDAKYDQYMREYLGVPEELR